MYVKNMLRSREVEIENQDSLTMLRYKKYTQQILEQFKNRFETFFKKLCYEIKLLVIFPFKIVAKIEFFFL